MLTHYFVFRDKPFALEVKNRWCILRGKTSDPFCHHEHDDTCSEQRGREAHGHYLAWMVSG